MNSDTFNTVVTEQISRSTSVLITKAKEYATDSDRLHNFKIAAELKGESTREALAGMMVKHTVSIYDMCKDRYSYTLEVWNEKITDHINYLLLLRAVIEDETD